MKTTLSLLSIGLSLIGVGAFNTTAAPDARCFEMRVYYAAPGKLDALQARFRNHTVKLFEKHGITNVGYWVPLENPENKLVYILAFPSREERDKMWKAFGADPEWQSARKASEVDGKLVAKVESTFLKATEFSPEIKPSGGATPRTFELRTYKCTPNNLPNLLARFANHTVKLFEKHGITNIGYWTPMDPKQGADDTLIYILAHQTKEAAAESFKNFRADPAWLAAREASEKSAGGPLTVKDGVKSEFMSPTDFSTLR